MHACMHAHTSRCVCLQWVKIDLQGGDYITVTVSGKYGRGSTLSRKSAKKIIDTFLCFQHVIEKEELKLHLQASKDAQRQLTAELHELQDRNAECLGMLHESQEEVKMLRSRASSVACLCHPQDSLAAEIEGTMRKELSQVDESLLSKQKSQQKRVFDTVRVANVTRGRSSFPAPLLIPGSNRSSVVMTAKPFQSG